MQMIIMKISFAISAIAEGKGENKPPKNHHMEIPDHLSDKNVLIFRFNNRPCLSNAGRFNSSARTSPKSTNKIKNSIE